MTSERGFNRVEYCALAYLGIPLLVFIVGWLTPWLAVLLLALLAYTVYHTVRVPGASNDAGLGASRWTALAAISFLWVASAGLFSDLGIALRLNYDWPVRLSALYDLVHGGWPVTYGPGQGGSELWLRFPMLYYLVPALVGKGAGIEAARLALAIQTALGVLLCFGLMLGGKVAPSWRRVGVFVCVWMLFSGMDLLGHLNDLRYIPQQGEHIEWWFPVLQYSSHTTLLFWVPNHALPGWLGALVLWRHRDAGLAVLPMALLLLLVGVSAPLPAIGLLPIALVASVQGAGLTAFRTTVAWFKAALMPATLATLPVALLLAYFYTFGQHNEARPPRPEFWWLIPLWVRFAFIEWAALATAVWLCRRQGALIVACSVVLLILPLFRYGPANDLVMRGGIAALALLGLAAAEVLLVQGVPALRRGALILVLTLGAATPLLEVQRAFMPGYALPPSNKTFVELWGPAVHYVGELQADTWMNQVLRTPHRLGGSATVPNGPASASDAESHAP